MSDHMTAGSIEITGAASDRIEAYQARPVEAPRGGVVVIHHMPGYDAATKEITRRFATMGYAAVCPNLYAREAPGADPSDAAAQARARGGVPDSRLVDDVAGAADQLRQLGARRIGVIGYCSGGRQAVLAACSLQLDAAVDCYGAYVVGEPSPQFPLQVHGLESLLGQLSCPLLGLFGDQDTHPSPAEVATLGEILRQHGKQFEAVSYPDAGHGFFATDRPSYRPLAAVAGWGEIGKFFNQQLAL